MSCWSSSWCALMGIYRNINRIMCDNLHLYICRYPNSYKNKTSFVLFIWTNISQKTFFIICYLFNLCSNCVYYFYAVTHDGVYSSIIQVFNIYECLQLILACTHDLTLRSTNTILHMRTKYSRKFSGSFPLSKISHQIMMNIGRQRQMPLTFIIMSIINSRWPMDLLAYPFNSLRNILKALYVVLFAQWTSATNFSLCHHRDYMHFL